MLTIAPFIDIIAVDSIFAVVLDFIVIAALDSSPIVVAPFIATEVPAANFVALELVKFMFEAVSEKSPSHSNVVFPLL